MKVERRKTYHWTPRNGVSSNEESSHDNQALPRSYLVWLTEELEVELSNTGPNDEHAEHEAATEYEGSPTAIVIDNVQTTERTAKVDSTENTLGDEGVAETSIFKHRGTIVQEEVGTGKLLEGLHDHTENDTERHARSGEEFMPLLVNVHFFQLFLDFLHFLDNQRVGFRNSVQLGHCSACGTDFAKADFVSWGFWEEDHANAEYQGKEHR